MILVKPSAEIIHITTEALQLIEGAGRTCYKSEDKITADSAPRFAGMILKRGHESVIEHAAATVRIVCDRGVTHEIVRHRLASYSQESTRYCNYRGGVAFVIPAWVEFLSPGEYDRNSFGLVNEAASEWFHQMLAAEETYQRLLSLGWKPEQARSVLPNSLKTEIVMTANLREWRHFFRLRTSTAAHPQMREVAVPLLAEFKSRVPVVFDDLVGEAF